MFFALLRRALFLDHFSASHALPPTAHESDPLAYVDDILDYVNDSNRNYLHSLRSLAEKRRRDAGRLSDLRSNTP